MRYAVSVFLMPFCCCLDFDGRLTAEVGRESGEIKGVELWEVEDGIEWNGEVVIRRDLIYELRGETTGSCPFSESVPTLESR